MAPVGGPAVAVLGTGTMGAPIARRLLDAGFSVRVWNRTQARAQPLGADGAHVTASPAEAADGAGVVLTMLSDGAAVEHAMLGPAGALAAMQPEAVWLQMSTIGPRWTDRFAALAQRHGVELVDAPVSGSDGPARAGELIVLASGSDRAHDRVRPVLDAFGRSGHADQHVAARDRGPVASRRPLTSPAGPASTAGPAGRGRQAA
jgi:3-hydroxyisobutyrate dehydrogenase